jgi:hypothetical protein
VNAEARGRILFSLPHLRLCVFPKTRQNGRYPSANNALEFNRAMNPQLQPPDTGGRVIMIELHLVPGTNVYELTIDGAISAEEFDAMLVRFEEAIAQHGKVRVLEEIRELGGIPPSKVWEDLKFGFRHMRDVERAAVVAKQKWIEVVGSLLNPFISAEVRYYKPEEREIARAWILEGAGQPAVPTTV